MKNMLKRLLPYVMINGITYAIIGAIIGKNYVNIRNTSNRINSDSKEINKYLREIAKTCPNKISFDEFENGDDRKPIKPMKIYVYN